MRTDNIIQFPNRNRSNMSTSDYETKIQLFLENIVPKLLSNFEENGFDSDNNTIKDAALLVEGMRSYLHKVCGLNHPLQLIADNLFESMDRKGNLEISNKVKIVITQKKDN